MATKKQKREAALAKREREMQELREEGQAALRRERARRERKRLQEWEENHNKNHNWKKRIKECPHCEVILKAATKTSEQGQAS